jgi:hypothetical protein
MVCEQKAHIVIILANVSYVSYIQLPVTEHHINYVSFREAEWPMNRKLILLS